MIRRAVLQLNASYEPLRIISAKKALTLVCKGVAIVEIPTSIQVHPGIYLPSVIRLRHYRHVPIRLQVVSRRNIILRDGNKCQYCGHRFESADLTLDHIMPKSRGGRNSWDNLVAACSPCNRKKGDKTPDEWGVRILRRPLPQSVHTSRWLLRNIGSEVEEWKKYLYC